MNNIDRLNELAAALATLSPADLGLVIRASATGQKILSPEARYVVSIAPREEIRANGNMMIDTIKATREATGYGLLEAKNAVEGGSNICKPGTLEVAERLANSANAHYENFIGRDFGYANTSKALAVSAFAAGWRPFRVIAV